LLLGQSARKLSLLPEGDARQLAHELQVHQMELEMQNNELRHVQLELEASRDRFARLYDFAPVGYLTLDRAGIIGEANLTATLLLDLDRRDIIGRKFTRFLAPESQEIYYLHQQKAWSSGLRETCQVWMRRPGRTNFTAELQIVANQPQPSEPEVCFLTMSDATERTRLEAERSRLAAIVESSSDAIISRSLDDTITSWNEGATRTFGYQPDEIVGRSFTLLSPLEKHAEAAEVRRRVMNGERIDSFETWRVTKDGRKFLVSSTVSPVRDALQNVVGISTISRDITRQKQAETALRESEGELDDFFAKAPLGLLWVGPSGHILRANEAFLELMARSERRILGRSIAEFYADPEIADHLLARLSRGETLQNQRLRLRQKNGSLKHVLIDANGLWDNSRLVHSRWFVRDITRRVELEREILNISEREQRRLGQDLHDDLGQQLAGIEFLAQSLVGRLGAISEPAAVQAREIARTARRTMVRARELARGLWPIGLETDGLMSALRELAARTKKLFRIDCRFRCEKPVLVHDHEVSVHLYRIAQEAISNAIKHGKARRIDIGLAMSRDRIMLAVSDNGIGLPVKRHNKGGLGLRVMQYRAGMIDASLVVQRKEDGGTTFACSVREPRAMKAVRKS
jgi:PAS domain S-box-containing protein